jgi:circadian clock protein KaiB
MMDPGKGGSSKYTDPARNLDPANPDPGNTLREFEELVAGLARPSYLFRLYVSGTSSRSALAIANVRRICDRYLAGHYELEVIDVYQQPSKTKTAQVVAIPTLIKELPFPAQRFVGDMSNTERIVIGLKLG